MTFLNINPLRNFHLQNHLSMTAYGHIGAYQHKKTKKQVVIKSADLHFASLQLDTRSHATTAEDIFLDKKIHTELSQFNHPHLLQLHQTFTYQNHLYFVMEYCQSGDLHSKVASAIKLSDHQVQQYFSQIVSGVSFIHQHGYGHGDVSLENILVNERDECQVCDFGLIAPLSKRKKTAAGKLNYMAPEMIKGRMHLPHQTDMWALGIVLFMLLTRKTPFTKADGKEVRFQMLKEHGIVSVIKSFEITREIPEGALDLLSQLLEVNPKTRMGMV